MAGSAYWHSPPLSLIADFNHAITYPFSHALRNYIFHNLIIGQLASPIDLLTKRHQAEHHAGAASVQQDAGHGEFSCGLLLIVMAVFDVAQSVVDQSAGVIISDAGIDISGVVGDLETTLADWSIGSLLGLWFQSVFVGLCSHILTIAIFLVIYGRMIEVYLTVSVGPIPFATMVNREWGHTGQNYLKSLLALGFQAFLIMVCVGIYAVLVQNIAVGDDITVAIWECMGYTVLLCYTLFKTGSLAKSLFGAH